MGKSFTQLLMGLAAALLLAVPAQAATQTKAVRKAHTLHAVKNLAKSQSLIGDKAVKRLMLEKEKKEAQLPDLQKQLIEKEQEEAWVNGQAPWKAQASMNQLSLRSTGRMENGRPVLFGYTSTAAKSRGPLKNIESEEEVDENGIIITPDKGEHKFYNRAGMGYYNSNGSIASAEQEGMIEIVECPDGKVYFKDFISYAASDTWIKGERSGNTITIPTGQVFFYNTTSDYGLYVALASKASGSWAEVEGNITLTVDGDVITLNNTDANNIVGAFWTDDFTFSGYGDYNSVFTYDPEYVAPEPIVLPENAEVEEWFNIGMTVTSSGSTEYSSKANVAFVGNEVYVSGLFEEFPEAWIKGTIDGTTVTFSGFQYLGMYAGYEIYATGSNGYNNTSAELQDFTMTYDATAQKLTAVNSLLANAAKDRIYFLEAYEQIVISKTDPNYKEVLPIDELPYENALNTKDLFTDFTVIDANEDGKTWSFNETAATTTYTYSSANNGDDWLISPAIKLEAGKKYHIALDAKNSGYPERFEVKLGAEATAEAMTTEVIPATDVTTKEFVTSEADAVTVAEDGYYYFGIHAISDADQFRLIVANFLVEIAADPQTPEAITDLAAEALADELGATLTFTAPAKGIDGNDLTDNLTSVDIYRDGQVIKSIGAAASIDWVAADQGYENAEDVAAIDFGSGITATLADGGGSNNPKYYNSGTTLRMYKDNTLTLNGGTFTKVEFTMASGYTNLSANVGEYSLSGNTGTWTGEADEIVFTVPSGQARIQSIHIETAGTEITPGMAMTYVDKAEDLTIGNHTYGVKATNAFGTSKMSNEVTIFLSATLTVPYVADFTQEGVFDVFNVIDANSDSNTWSWSASYGAYYSYSSTNDADDYLVTMPIKLEAGKNYNVGVTARAASADYPEAFEVVLGKTATALNTAILDEVTVNTTDPTLYENVFTVAETGEYYVAIHATSPADQYRLMVSKLAIEDGPSNEAPAAPEVTVIPDPEGALKATINITASTLNFAGNALTGNTDFQILRNDEPVGTITGIAPGAETSFVNEVDSAYFYTYQVIASNANGEGGKSEKVKVFVGTDVPVAVENLAAADQGTSIVFTWDKVGGVGMNGGYVNPANVDYNLWSLKIVESTFGSYLDFDELLSTQRDAATTTFETDTEEGEQDFSYYAIQTANETGEGDASVAALITGKSYDLPVIEGFTGSSFHYLWDYDGDITISTDASDGDDVALNFYSEEAGIYYFASGKLNLKSAANPYLFFDVKSPSVSQIAVIGSVDGGEAAPLQTVNVTDEYTTVKVPLAELRNGRYAQVGFIYQIVNPTEIDIDWSTYDYIYNWGDTLLADNFKIVDLLEYDMVINATAPKTVKAGNDAQIKITLTNQGENAAKNYTVKLLKGEEEIFSETVADELGFYETKEFTVDYPTTIFTEAGDVTLTAKVIYENDLDEDNNITEVSFTVVTPSQTPVSDLAAAQQENTIVATWTAPEASAAEVTESFEDGLNGWTAIDADGDGFNWDTHVNTGEGNYTTHTGDGCAWSASYDNDTKAALTPNNWLVSPQAILNGTFTFWACGQDASYAAEHFAVFVSTTSATDLSTFTKVSDEFIATSNLTEYSVDLSSYAGQTGWIAIRHYNVTDMFVLVVDDVTFLTNGGTPESFNVYLDEELVTTVTEPTATIENITNGSHKVSVTAVYANGESAPVSVTVEVSDVVGIDQILASGKKVDVYSTDGRMVRQQATSLSGLKSGVYVIDNKKVIVK